MKFSAVILSTLVATALARPDVNENKSRAHARDVRRPYSAFVRPRWNVQLGRREVPQEHSHEKFLTAVGASLKLDNPDGIVDPVFGLLGNGAAAKGLGSLTDPECLQQSTADRAFTNAKAAGDVTGMTAALIYRALERNTGAVGLASNSCTTVTAVNPEIASIQQHQDPASTGAAAKNKDITLNLAVQISSVGGNPQDALQSGTFAPGKIGDPTAAGNTCDVQNDAEGCIFTQNLLVEDATADEIAAAVAAGGGPGKAPVTTSAAATTADVPKNVAATTDAKVIASTAAAAMATVTVVQTSTLTECPTAANAAVASSTGKDGGKGKGKGKTTAAVTITEVQTVTVTEAAAAAIANGMTVITMPMASASSAMSQLMSMGMVTVTETAMAAQTAIQIQTDTAVATITATDAAATATQTIDCSGAIASALAAAGLAGADVLTGTSAATNTAKFANITTAAAVAEATATADASNTGTVINVNINLGSATDATIIFAVGLDGRKEGAFAPNNQKEFSHGSALGIKVITEFICQQLNDKYKAPAATIDACNAAAAAAQKEKGQAAADAFNNGMGS